MKEELRFALRHPVWSLIVTLFVFFTINVIMALYGFWWGLALAMIEWVALVALFTYAYNKDARNVDVDTRAREEEL